MHAHTFRVNLTRRGFALVLSFYMYVVCVTKKPFCRHTKLLLKNYYIQSYRQSHTTHKIYILAPVFNDYLYT